MESLRCNHWPSIDVINTLHFDYFKFMYLEKVTDIDDIVLLIRPEYIRKENSEGYIPNCPEAENK